MLVYIKKIWSLRYFIGLLVLNDIAQKYRRSYLGMLWAVLQPMMFALIVTLVIGRFIKQPVAEFFPFVFIGFIVWEMISSCIRDATNTFIVNAQYIKQFSNPLMVFTVRLTLFCALNFVIAILGAILILTLVSFIKMSFSILTLPISLMLVVFFIAPIVNIVSLFGAMFRDLQQLVGVVLQVLFYCTPIFFQPIFFIDNHLEIILKLNPIFHIIQLFRKPLLEGTFPSLTSYLFLIGLGIFFHLINALCIRFKEKKIINYL